MVRMAKLALAREFLSDYGKLQKPLQAKVSELAVKFQQLTAEQLRSSKGIHLEQHQRQRDPRARTIRIDDNHRGIVLDTGNDDLYVLCAIDTHDKTDRWIAHNEFRVNEATGALELVDTSAITGAIDDAETQRSATPADQDLLYAHRADKEFRQLGVQEDLLPTLRAFTNEDQLQGLLMVLPQGQAEALVMLLGHESVDVLYGQIAPDTDPDQVDIGNLAAAVEKPASRAQFRVFTEQDDLQRALAQPLAQWRTYLHASQEQAAYRPHYNGPARVTGGAGTGKTVVAMHRTRFLADQLQLGLGAGLGESDQGKPILFTTFTKNLAQAIERDLRSLGGDGLLDVVEVINVDRLAHRVVRDAEQRAVPVARQEDVRRLWQDAVDDLGLRFTPEFLTAEFEQVILAQDCGSASEYLAVNRSGRGFRLSRDDRARVWEAVDRVTQDLAVQRRRTHLQVAADAAGYLTARSVKPYRHVIVDEAQDLHETQWRLLRAAVDQGPNDMFIVGDSHQRIYDRRASLSKVGINIIGRSRRLRLNYRTTHEILRWSLAFLGEGRYDDLDEGTETQTLAEYHSYMHGDPPVMAGFATRSDEVQDLVGHIRSWIDGGIAPEAIAVAARVRRSLDPVRSALTQAGIPSTTLGSELPNRGGVRLGTMHRLKGVEFRCVALIDMGDEMMPLPRAVTAEAADPVQHQADLQRERCIAYVASTRAREHLWIGWSGQPSPFLRCLLHDHPTQNLNGPAW